MLSALIQTIANLGFDAGAITDAFNKVMATIQNGDTSTLSGLSEVFIGVVSAFTGVSTADLSAVVTSIISSVIAILSDDSTSSVLSTIIGA